MLELVGQNKMENFVRCFVGNISISESFLGHNPMLDLRHKNRYRLIKCLHCPDFVYQMAMAGLPAGLEMEIQ